MNRQLVVRSEIVIEAPVSKVWEVLIAPKYIRQWDDLPSDFEDYYLEYGRTIEWSGRSKITFTICQPNEILKMSLYVSKWEQPPAAYDIAYTYRLGNGGTDTVLSIEIGDFSELPDGEDYYNASVDFAAKAAEKIKNLSENRV
ncbi:MAG: SRPBCC domain-containing protein [Dyadobacter sp.]|uniref:SRPBCC domain-containing protein n=1 Tax=Dyadobacter sp. TaxID=1914288 RepID=UPI00326748E5